MLPTSSIKVWRDSNLSTNPQPIDPTHVDSNGNHVGYPCYRLQVLTGVNNSGEVRVWDQSESPGMYAPLGAGRTLELYVNNTNLIKLSGSAASQEAAVVIERKEA